MPGVVLDQSQVVPLVRQGKTTRMPQHMAQNERSYHKAQAQHWVWASMERHRQLVYGYLRELDVKIVEEIGLQGGVENGLLFR